MVPPGRSPRSPVSTRVRWPEPPQTSTTQPSSAGVCASARSTPEAVTKVGIRKAVDEVGALGVGTEDVDGLAVGRRVPAGDQRVGRPRGAGRRAPA